MDGQQFVVKSSQDVVENNQKTSPIHMNLFFTVFFKIMRKPLLRQMLHFSVIEIFLVCNGAYFQFP